MMQKRLNDIRMKHVVEEEKKIVFGGKVSTWHDVEGDEATFDKRDVSTEEGWQEQVQDKKCILWGQWSGLVQSGKPRASRPQSAQTISDPFHMPPVLAPSPSVTGHPWT